MGPSRTVVGEGVLVNLQGGSSKVLGRGIMSEQGRGFPGCSSHLNGTEAEVWRGGVDGWSGDSMLPAPAPICKNGSFTAQKHASSSPM